MNHARRSVLIVTQSLEAGGTEGQIALLAEELVHRDWNVFVFALDPRGALATRLPLAGVAVLDGGHPFGRTSRVQKWLAVCRTLFCLISICVRERPQVVHCFLPVPNFLGSVAARLTFVPRIITSRRVTAAVYQDKHPKLKRLDRLSNALSHVVVANSHAVAADTALRDGCPEGKIQVTPNALDLTRFREVPDLRAVERRKLGLQDDQLGIVKVANFFPYKGHADLIEAFCLIEPKIPEAHLFLVGKDQGVQGQLRERVELLGLNGKIAFLGQRADIPELLSAMDVAVQSSYAEGLSNALLEELAMGLPVVTTDIAENAEAVEGMPNCRLVRPRDPEDLARGLSEVIDMVRQGDDGREMRRRLIEERHSVQRMVDAYERLYLGAGPATNDRFPRRDELGTWAGQDTSV
jgi:glycosyltransferase involved in cell wall biosynthesis